MSIISQRNWKTVVLPGAKWDGNEPAENGSCLDPKKACSSDMCGGNGGSWFYKEEVRQPWEHRAKSTRFYETSCIFSSYFNGSKG